MKDASASKHSPDIAGLKGLPPYPGFSRRKGTRAGRSLEHAAQVLWGGMLVALICVAGLMALSWIQSQGAVALVRAQAEAIRDGNLESAYDMFSNDYRSSISLPMFRRWLRRQPTFSEIKDLRIWGRSAWRGAAILWGSFQDGLGRSYPVRYSLIRENGNWRIDDVQVRSENRETLPNTGQFHYI
jgi:hypothetical protein